MVAEWLENIDVNGEHRLQSWVMCQAATPSWAQGIVVLDAAHVLANEPEEGMQHEERPPAQPAVQEPDAMGCKCSECGEWQRWTPSGMVCKNGHGGASGINHRLYTTPPAAQPAVPEGWKLVPVEPTHGMVKAFQDAMSLEFGMRTTAGYHARVYSAMLATAPEKGQP
jgi:hypothetical protein